MTDFDTDIATLENALRMFAQTMKRPARWAQVMAEAGVAIDHPATIILHTLVMQQPKRLGVQDLATLLGIEPLSVTRKTQELERAGLLRRSPDPEDRRAVSLEVTPAGIDAANRLWKVHRQTMSKALADWPAADRHKFVNLFERFSHDLAASVDTTKTTKQKD